MSADDVDGDDWYEIGACWIREVFEGREAIIRRHNLKPIIPPPLTEPAPSIPEKISS
jgi:hypothetical protein